MDEGEKRGVVDAHAEKGEHPYQEEVVGHESSRSRKPNRLDADALNDLLIGVAVEESPSDFAWI